MRLHILYSNLFTFLPQSNDCDQDCEGQYLANERFTLDDSPTHTFKSCSWKDCSDSLGGAISFRDHTASSLIVTQCVFCSCKSTSSEWMTGGGAIHCYKVSSVSINFSSFFSCSCSGGGSGGINLCYIQNQPSLWKCDIIACSASADGGGISVWHSYAKDDQLICTQCRIINCYLTTEINNGYTFVGGAIILWMNTDLLKCSDSLFACNTGWGGGAYANDHNLAAQNYALSFCFFHQNKGTCGNDIYLSSLPSYSACLHCFSTSDSDRIGYYSGHFTSTNTNWLPLIFTNVDLQPY